MLPNFLVIGAMKSGTTSLCQSLGQHPEVFMCNPKEPCFFSHYYDRGLAWYESFFEGAMLKSATAIGEGTPEYTKQALYPFARDRIVATLPQARLIYIVRNPKEQIVSNWMHCIAGGDEHLPFNRAVREHPSYVDTASYMLQLQRYLDYYDRSQILVLFFEDFRTNPHQVLENCFMFLGVNPNINISSANVPLNASLGKMRDMWYTRLVKSTRLAQGFAKRLPEVMVSAARPFLKRPIRSRPEWNPITWHWVLSQIENSTKQFLWEHGKLENYWNLELRP